MSTSDFKKVLVKDDRIGNITDQICYAVVKGGQSITAAQYLATSASASSHTFNVQVPSMETIIDRRVMWRCTTTIKIDLQWVGPNSSTSAQTTNDVSMIGYGGVTPTTYSSPNVISALSPFPLQNSCSTITATINNTSISQNMQDLLPVILRFNDKNELFKYNSTTPAQYDVEGSYGTSLGTSYNSLAGFENSVGDYIPRGSWKIDNFKSSWQGGIPNNGSEMAVYITYTVTEPLLMSPFLFCNPSSNNSGLYGVQNMNFVMNIGPANRVFRTTLSPIASALSSAWNFKQCTFATSDGANPFTGSTLLFNFITPHPSDLLPSRNVVPYYELPRYIQPGGELLAVVAPTLTSPAVFPDAKMSSQVIPLNQIPDKLIIYVKKRLSSQTAMDADNFLPITGVTLQFNNNAGLLSSFQVTDLFRVSRDAGYNGSYYEFAGMANGGGVTQSDNLNYVMTSGSVVILDFATTIQLPEDFYSAGSIGNFTLQANITVKNNSGIKYLPGDLDVVLVTMNSGCMVTERGTSQVYTALLTKQDVLDASSQVAVTKSDVKRLVGGNFWDSLKSFVGPVAKAIGPIAKTVLGAIPNPQAQIASNVLGMLGAGESGAGYSGGGVSGGKRRVPFRGDPRLL